MQITSLKAEREREAKRLAEAEDLAAERLASWLAGSTAVSSYLLRGVGVRLRIRGDVVETSLGASIPVADAIALWPIIERCRNGDKCFTPRQKLGSYELTSIKSDGSTVVGCHSIPYSELARMAVELAL